MNPLQLSARYLQGYGANRGIQEAVDYGLGAAIGAGGQQLMNWATQGADPNPLLSGALFAPVGAAAVRGRRLNRDIARADDGEDVYTRGALRNAERLGNQIPYPDKIPYLKDLSGIGNRPNPYAQAALLGSLAGMVGGAGTSIYNTVAGGDDIDNNTIAGGLALLGSIAPLTYSAIRSHHMRGDEIKNMDNIGDVFPPVGTSRNPVNPKTGYYGSVGTSYPFDIANAPTSSGRVMAEDRLLDRLFNRSK